MKQLAAFDIPSTFFHNQSGGLQTITTSPAAFISHLLPNILVTAGVIFFLMILFGGFGLIVGAGHESSPQSAAKAKSAVTFAVIGFLLVISAYFILQIISTLTDIPLLNPPV